MSRKGNGKYTGNISCVRAVEDCIRATKKYTEGIFTIGEKHPAPIQGAGMFPSRAFSKFYEVYPDLEVGWEMSASDFLDWLWRETPCINLRFYYDYRTNKASVAVTNSAETVQKLRDTIPGIAEALDALTLPSKKRCIEV